MYNFRSFDFAVTHFLRIFASMLTKTEALVLHAIKYGEQKLIVDMFTRTHGRLSFVVSLSKGGRGRMKKQYFQPLTHLSIECDLLPQRQLQKLSDVAIATPLSTLLYDPSKLSISLFLSEFLYHALKGEQQNEPLFDYVMSSIQWLDGRERDFANFHLVFLMHLSRFLGFYPNLDRSPLEVSAQVSSLSTPSSLSALYFDLRSATFCSRPPVHRDFLMPEEASQLMLMMRMDFPTMHLFRMSRRQRQRCVEVALLYYRLHLPDFPDLRSLSILRELYEE